MSRKLEDYAHIEGELIALLQNLLAELPPDTASLEVTRVSGGVVVLLKPTNPAAASVRTHAENGFGLIDFSFGEYEPTWELPFEGYNPRPSKNELLREVEAMCKAVMAGCCEHTRGFLNVAGTIQVGSRPYRVRHMFVWSLKPPFKRTRKYEPYV
jgi:hypothetical protein